MNFDNKDFCNGKIADFRKRRWEREYQKKCDSMLDSTSMDRNKKLLQEENNKSYEAYSKILQRT